MPLTLSRRRPIVPHFPAGPVESWHSSPGYNRLHCVAAGQRHARCGAAALRWLPPNDYADPCPTCMKRAAGPTSWCEGAPLNARRA